MRSITTRIRGALQARAADRSPCDKVRLTWVPIFENAGTTEVVVDRSDTLYRIYEDCLRYLREEYPTESLKCSIPNDITIRRASRNTLKNVIPHFDGLINLLAGSYRAEEFYNMSHEERLQLMSTLLGGSSMLGFIMSGLLAAFAHRGCHITCAFRASRVKRSDDDVYRALFLDCTYYLWMYECFLRTSTSVWSPMPWSRVSEQELSGMAFVPAPPQFDTSTVVESDLVDEDFSGLPVARSIGGSPVDIPWLNARHDGYPFCSTLSAYTSIRCNTVPRSFRDDAAIWLSAMTFGLLEAVTRRRIHEAMFLVPGASPGGTVLSGTRILRFLLRWLLQMHEDDHEDDAHLAHGQDVARLLDRAFRALDEDTWVNTNSFLRAGFSDDEAQDMICAVALTVSLLTIVAHGVWWETTPELHPVFLGTKDDARPFYLYSLNSCERRMCAAGWCPNIVTRPFLSALSGLTMVSNLIRLPPYIRSAPNEHKDCDELSCTFYTISDPNSYVPRHMDLSCHCEYTKPPLEDVEALLSQGIIPCMVFDGTQLIVQPSTSCAYVAISHVWADGMGSTTDDGLPTCMVARIAGLARMLLPDSGAFWMDSLSVPAGGTLRKRAIKLMAQTYRDAAKVLVIDECIRTQCSEGKPWEENLFRIATSGWVRRVWTLQEGLLARELYFEFIEGPVHVEGRLGLNVQTEGFDPSLRNGWLEYLPSVMEFCRSHVPLLAFRAANQDWNSKGNALLLNEVVRLLKRRTTSKPEDEVIAISSLLPVNLDRILAVTGPDAAQRRMREFLIQQRDVPKVFPMQGAPRLALPGFSWAPQTLALAVGEENLSSGTGICTEDGLFAEYFMASLAQPVGVPPECIDGSQSGFDFDINYSGSASVDSSEESGAMSAAFSGTAATRKLFVHIHTRHIPSTSLVPITALLFVHGSLETQSTVRGFAVSSRFPSGSQRPRIRLPAQIDTGGNLPRPVRYVAPFFLDQRNRHEVELRGHMDVQDGVTMSELRKTWVFLT